MDIIQTINRLGSPRILVIGDLILDKYIWGKVNRISPEAPIQVLDVEREEIRLGGAANVAHNLVTLGARVTCIGTVGKDETGKKLRSQMRRAGINTRGIIIDTHKPTPVKTRMIAHNQQVLRVDQEDLKPVTAPLESQIINRLKKHLKNSRVILVSDYGKGTLTPRILKTLFAQAKRNRISIIVDPKGRDYRKYRGASGIIPNRHEAELVTGIDIKDARRRREAARRLLKGVSLKFIIITLGKEGIYLLDRMGKETYSPARARSVYDVTGAGDTTLAALGMGLASGLDYKSALDLANLAAGVVVSKLGTATVSRNEIIEHFQRITGQRNNVSKTKDLDGLMRILTARRQNQSSTIVFTNGCFDILHPGHIKSLEFARAQGDILVVGLNSDKSVRALKGKGRPLFSQTRRVRALAALESVDYVVVFNEPTPLKLIRGIKPDVLVKGADWKKKGVVGNKFIKSYGGKVVFAPLEKGVSTTGILRKLAYEKDY